MKLIKVTGMYSVVKVSDFNEVNWQDPFVFVAKTDDELSLVCRTEVVPSNTIAREDNWNMLKIAGELDFGMIGVIAKISTILAEHKISVFVVSTYNTDYILVKEENYFETIQLLQKHQFTF